MIKTSAGEAYQVDRAVLNAIEADGKRLISPLLPVRFFECFLFNINRAGTLATLVTLWVATVTGAKPRISIVVLLHG